MKKFLSVIFSLLFILPLFSSCTVQEEVSPDLFVARFSEAFPDFVLEKESMFYEKNACVVFVNSPSGKRYAVEMTLDEKERVRKISLAGTDRNNSEEFESTVGKILAVYAPSEDCDGVAKALFDGRKYSYHETEWYYYSFSATETGLFFAVENKKLSPEKDLGLTLKENDIVTTSGE